MLHRSDLLPEKKNIVLTVLHQTMLRKACESIFSVRQRTGKVGLSCFGHCAWGFTAHNKKIMLQNVTQGKCIQICFFFLICYISVVNSLDV
jgi:hypothetical protein